MSDTPADDKLMQAVEQFGALGVLGASELSELKAWAADKVNLVVVDMDTQVILYASPAAEKVFGYMLGELENKPLEWLIPEAKRPAHKSHVDGFNQHPDERTMGRRDWPLEGRKKDGSPFPIEIGLFPRTFRRKRICVANFVSVGTKEAAL